MSDQVFIYVLGPDMHDWIGCQPITMTLSHYYDSQRMVDLRQRVEMAEEHACTGVGLHCQSANVGDAGLHLE